MSMATNCAVNIYISPVLMKLTIIIDNQLLAMTPVLSSSKMV